VCGVGRRRSVVGRLSPFINQWRPVVAGTGCAAPPPRRSAGRTQRRRQKPAAAPSSTRNPPEDYPDRQFFFTFRRFPPRLPLFLAGGHGTAVISLRPSPRFSSPPAPSRSRLLPNSSPLRRQRRRCARDNGLPAVGRASKASLGGARISAITRDPTSGRARRRRHLARRHGPCSYLVQSSTGRRTVCCEAPGTQRAPVGNCDVMVRHA